MFKGLDDFSLKTAHCSYPGPSGSLQVANSCCKFSATHANAVLQPLLQNLYPESSRGSTIQRNRRGLLGPFVPLGNLSCELRLHIFHSRRFKLTELSNTIPEQAFTG
jgi:hypothetical protein